MNAATVLDVLSLRGGINTATVLLGTSALGLACGCVGAFALFRKRSLMADALSHATLPGVATAFLLAASLGVSQRSLPVLLTGAAISSVLGVLCVLGLLRCTRLREDAAIGIVLSVFFGVGVVLLSIIQSHAPTGAAGLRTLLLGQTAAMLPSEARLLGTLALGCVLITTLLLKELTLLTFDAPFARVTGWPVLTLDVMLMALVVLVTVAGLPAVGIILVVALLIIPPVAARFWSDRVPAVALIAALGGGASCYVGAALSATLPNAPAGAVIVLCAGAWFLLSMSLAPKRGVLAATLRGTRLRVRIALDHALEHAHEHHSRDAQRVLAEVSRHRHWPFWLRIAVPLSLRHRRFLVGSTLTPEALLRGARVARNHALWSQYLITHAQLAPSHVDWSVDQVEHVLGDDVVARLEADLHARRIDEASASHAAEQRA